MLYLEHCLSDNKIIPLHDNTLSIKEFPKPSYIKSLQRFLGKVNFYHKFIVNAPKILHPLYDLLKKGKKFLWTEECENAFQQIKDLLASQPVLAVFNPNSHCYLFTDASRQGLGAVLKQVQTDGELHPIGYFSKKLLKYQQNYSVTELECLAIVEVVEYFHHYLYGQTFTIITDHQTLK